MKVRKFVVTQQDGDFHAGDIVYKATVCDYGLASDDSNYTGVPHISVSRTSNGVYPLTTIPECNIVEIE